MVENSQELIPPPSIGESKSIKQELGGEQRISGSKIWIVVLLCVVVGVGVGIFVYQKSLAPKTARPTPTPIPVITPKPLVMKTPTPTPAPTIVPQTQLPVVPESTESASLLEASPSASGSAQIAEINLVNPVGGMESASPSASVKPSAVASPSARVTMPEGSALPDAGVLEITTGTLGVGALLVLLGMLGLLVL